ncbi:transglutaminase family protein [Aquisalimonas asiatica]|uniref:Transglutaminase-like enzyme, putative cysteine protease n=1 Tax=Aquisalimonas asiatica TaxID=406100 RepID=A0A1H8UA05_9GAMM|nr:transglutaminase family protein [Aquisalimonas asiatica]SEP00031.1 Transglutaminase-like enzyme, putative cysteine protease [Aquisalimonas asiatica]
MKYRITHRTEYHYPRAISRSYNETHLAPRTTPDQQVLAHSLTIAPRPDYTSERTDYYGNRVTHFTIQRPHDQLAVTATTDVALEAPADPVAHGQGLPWEQAVATTGSGTAATALAVREFLLDSPLVETRPDLTDYARASFAAGQRLPEAVHHLMGRIHRDFAYDPMATTISTPLERVFRERRGVCQDFAHLAIACLRGLGIAARYVSGYVETAPADGTARLIGADASHAWFAAHDPSLGWIDFDPTNNRMPGTQHITTAWGRDYADVSPLKGVIFGGSRGQRSHVAVDVQRLPSEDEP